MSLIQQMLFAIRTLTEDDTIHSKYKHDRHKTPRRNSSRHHQSSALVITFRDLFTTGGLNYLLEDAETSRHSSKKKVRKNQQSNKTPEDKSAIVPSIVKLKQSTFYFTSDLTSPVDHKRVPAEAWFIETSPSAETVPLLHEERIISSSEIAQFACSGLNSTTSPRLATESTSREVEVFQPSRWNRKRENVVVSLTPDDENKTVATLRKVLKWSPRKQNAAEFALPLPKNEKHKAVAVVQNAVNRVKEEQEQKKKRKIKLFNFTFC